MQRCADVRKVTQGAQASNMDEEVYLNPDTFVSAFDRPSARRAPRDRSAAKQAQSNKAYDRAQRSRGVQQLLHEDPIATHP
mmetsp:Transcript_51630/g.85633  ORF Transcript_51630/g.85633 Transcript_51630/m.85633 type:complete len:81 (+) Transcript_51630:207-449(+)